MKSFREQAPRPLLSRFRGRFARGMLLLGMFMSVLPPVRLRAEEEAPPEPPPVNDTWWGDVWRWIDGGQQWFAYQNVGEWGDDDGDDIPNGLDPYPWDSSNNTGWLRASNIWSDAVLHETWDWAYATDRSWQLDWYDSDGDGLPNWCDPRPYDSANNTTWWNAQADVDGVSSVLSAIERTDIIDWNDYDGDGLPNSFDPYPWDASNNTSRWSLEAYIDAILGLHDGMYATSGGWQDLDDDGLPDWADPYVDSAENNTSWWRGGSFWIDGQEQWFGDTNTPYATAWDDADHDGIPNFADPMPYDAANNTTWWSGEYVIDGSTRQLGGVFAAGGLDWADFDSDGIPNFVDPYLYDSGNNNSNTTAAVTDTTSWYDSYVDTMWQDWGDNDGDGLPNFSDPYPDDATNNTTQWVATQDYLVDGALQTPGGSYATDTLDWNDDDGDELPNFVDPYPQDADNNSALWWAQSWVDGAAQDVLGAYAANADTSTWSDLDEDGLPDWLDPYPEDADNNTAWWWGNAWIDGGMQDIAGTYAASESATISWEDTDEDGLPDWLDPYPQDAGNNTAWWMDESYVDGEIQTLMASYAADQMEALSWEDRDFDGLPDWCDPYPDDFANNTIWWEDTFLIDGVRMTLSGIFANEGQNWDDSDGDWIPDFLDPYPADPANNTAFWNGAGWIDGKWEEIAVPYAASGSGLLDLTDSDGDLLPDVFDPYPADMSNNTSFWNGGEFVIDGTRQTLPGDATPYARNLEDADGDGLPAFADPYPEDAANLAPPPVTTDDAAAVVHATLDTLFEADRIFFGGPTLNWGMLAHIDGVLYEVGGTFAENGPDWDDADGDLLPNFLDPYPADPANNTAFWNGAAMIDGDMEELHVPYAADQLAALDLEDADGDLLPNAFDPYPEDASNNTSHWGGGEFVIDGLSQSFLGDGRAYATDADDADSDLIPDFADPYPYDETNTALLAAATLESGEMTSGGGSAAAETLQNTLQQAAASTSGLPAASAPQVAPIEVAAPELAATQVAATQVVTPQVTVLPPLTPEQAIAALAGQLPEQMILAQAGTGSLGVAGGVPPAPPVQPFVQVAKPTEADSDGDGLDDLAEVLTHLTNPTDPDTDDDGLFDGWEIAHALNPLDATDIQRDTDNDGLTNAEELVEKTDPGKADMDGGGASDKEEVEHRRLRRLLEDQGVPPEEMAALLPPGVTSYDPYDPQDDKTPDEEDQPPEEPENPEPPGPPEPPTPPDHEDDHDDMDDPPQDGGDGQNDGDGEGDGGEAPPPPPRVDNDQDGWTADIDPDDNDPTVPGQAPPPPPPPPPQEPPGETLLEKVAREKKEKQDAHQKRNEELSKARQERRQKRAEARKAARELNHLLGHPHGNHGFGVKNAGARGTRSDLNPNGAPPFVPTPEYARSRGYQNTLRGSRSVGGPKQAWSADGWSFAEQEQMRQQAREDRNTRLGAEHDAGVERRAAERQAQRDLNNLLSHPHGNHGNGVKNPGARGIRTADNENGALAFQASEEYAQTDAYKNQTFENQVKQAGRDALTRARLQEQARQQQAAQEAGQWNNMLKPQLVGDIAQQGLEPGRTGLHEVGALAREQAVETLYQQARQAASGITPELLQTNPGFAARWAADQLDTILNGAPQTTLSDANHFANRASVVAAGGVGAAAGWDAVGFDPSAGVGPDGATSLGLDPATSYLPVTWDLDSDGDKIPNDVESDLGSDPENPNSRPSGLLQQIHAMTRQAQAQNEKSWRQMRVLEQLRAAHELALINRSENNWLSKITFGAREFNANAPEFFFGDFSRMGDRLDNAGIQGGAGFVSGGAAGALTGAGVGVFFSGVGAGPGALTGGGIGALGGLAEGSVAGFFSSPDMSFEDSLKQGALIGTFNGLLGGASTPLVLRSAGTAANNTTRVGRWMSEAEHAAMVEKGLVQESFSGTTHVASPATSAAYQAQARAGSVYVEFDVPASSLKATQEGWAKILGPSTIEGRLAAKKGLPVPQMPAATNIEKLATKP